MQSSRSGRTLRDHAAAGFRIAKRLALFDTDPGVRTASLGLDMDGRDQLMIVGGQLVRILRPNGAEVGIVPRLGIRSVEVVDGLGLRLVLPDKCWIHCVSGGHANELRSFLIRMPLSTPAGRDGGVIPEQNWQFDRLANLVGKVVIRAAEAEHNLNLIAAYGSGPDLDPTIYGRTGMALTKRLERMGKSSVAIADLAERYGAWAEQRNQLVHSVRPLTDGRPGPATHRMKIPSKGEAVEAVDIPYEVRTQDLPDLVDLWYAFNWLWFDSSHAFLTLIAGTRMEDLPMPNSVRSEKRLPRL